MSVEAKRGKDNNSFLVTDYNLDRYYLQITYLCFINMVALFSKPTSSVTLHAYPK